MRNMRIPGFPAPEDQDTLQFYVLKSLSYSARILLYLGCIASGFIVQIITVSFLPGAFLLIFAALINMVKGYSIKPARASKQYEDNWIRTGMEKVHQINRIKENIDKWDKDAMDISNKAGCMVFGLVTMLLVAVLLILISQVGYNVALIFFADSLILVLSLWFNGMKIKGNQDILYIKTDIIIELEKHFEKLRYKGESFVPSLMLAKDKEGKDYPTDCRFNIVFDNAPAGFYGILAQININTVDTNYPYFYCVITAKAGFGIGKYSKRIDIPQNIVSEYSRDGEAEVIVIRQRTAKNSGYHTKMTACKNIFNIALSLARLILEDNKR